MTDTSSDRNPVERLAEEFIARKRRGERPTLAEYTDKYPELAAEIRDLFPALLLMENLGESLPGTTGPHLGGSLTFSQLGDYRILREVGRGGMGVVFEAEQVSLGRRVALKVLPPHLLKSEQQVRRFEREARAAARLHHTNIVPVFGVGRHEGTHFYVMQFIQGLGLDCVIKELRQLHKGPAKQPAPVDEAPGDGTAAQQIAHSLLTGVFQAECPSSEAQNEEAAAPGSEVPHDPTMPRLPEGSDLSGSSGYDRRCWQSVARIGVQVASALEHAHSQGILHRDIKPPNLLMDTKGTVWVTDFGLAKAGEEDALTSTGDVVGTIRYMAPERFQTAGDVRSDVYSLGLTLYEMLALRPAFTQRDRPQLIDQVLHTEPPALSSLNRAVPRDLETIVHKAIAKDPRQRYARAADLGADLQRFLEDRPILARPIGSLEVLLKWVKRRPAVAALVALVWLVTLVGLGAFAWQYAEALREGENTRKEAHFKDEAILQKEVEAGLKEKALKKAELAAIESGKNENAAKKNEKTALKNLDSLKRTLFTAQLVRAAHWPPVTRTGPSICWGTRRAALRRCAISVGSSTTARPVDRAGRCQARQVPSIGSRSVPTARRWLRTTRRGRSTSGTSSRASCASPSREPGTTVPFCSFHPTVRCSTPLPEQAWASPMSARTGGWSAGTPPRAARWGSCKLRGPVWFRRSLAAMAVGWPRWDGT